MIDPAVAGTTAGTWLHAPKAPARAEGVHHAYVAKLLRLTLLAPDILEAVLDGRLPRGVRLEELVRPLPADWMAQRQELLGRRADPPAGTRGSTAGPVGSR